MTRKEQRLMRLAKVSAIVAVSAVSASAGKAALPPPGRSNADGIPPAITRLIADGEKAMREGNIPLAVIQLKNASSALPQNGRIRAELGAALLQSGDYYSAERELRQARKDGASDRAVLPALLQTMLSRHEEKALLEEFPDASADMDAAVAPDIYRARALALQSLGRPADAVASMEKSLKLRRDVSAILTRARIAQQQKEFPTAINFADEAAKLKPNDPGPLLFKFGLLLDAHDLSSALALSDQLIEKFPTSILVRLSRVAVFIQTNQNAKANAEISSILTKNPGNALASYYRALVMLKTGNAKESWRNAQTLPPEFLQTSPAIALGVSQMAFQAGASNTAAAILSAAITKFPTEAGLRLSLAAIRLRQNDTVGAFKVIEPVRDTLDPATAEALAKFYVGAGKKNEALALLQKLDQAGKGTDATSFDIISLQAQQGRTEEALSRLMQMGAQKPTDPLLAGKLVGALSLEGRFSEALAVADRLATDPKQRPLALALHAQVLLAQRNFNGALDFYNKAIQLDSKNRAGLFGRAVLFELMHKYADANTDIRVLIGAYPKDIAAYLKLAEVAAAQGHDQEVRSVLSQAIKQAPQASGPRLALGRYLLLRKDYQAALTAAGDLVRLQPADPNAVAFLGQVQGAAGQQGKAVATFRRLVDIAPKSAASQLLLGNALFASGDRAAAKVALEKAVNLDPKSGMVRAAQINNLVGQGDFDHAIASARAFQSINPSSQADALLGDTLAKAGRRDEAASVYKQSFKARPDSGMLMLVVRSEMDSGHPQTALDSLADWLGKYPKDTAVRLQYATMLMSAGEKGGAVKQYEIILKDQPQNILSLNNLAWLKQTDNPKQAIALVTRAAELAPDEPDVLDTLAWLKLQQKQAGSLQLLQRAHNLRPTDGQITYHLVLALDANGQRDAARGLLKALLESKTKFNDLQAARELSARLH